MYCTFSPGSSSLTEPADGCCSVATAVSKLAGAERCPWAADAAAISLMQHASLLAGCSIKGFHCWCVPCFFQRWADHPRLLYELPLPYFYFTAALLVPSCCRGLCKVINYMPPRAYSRDHQPGLCWYRNCKGEHQADGMLFDHACSMPCMQHAMHAVSFAGVQHSLPAPDLSGSM